MALIIKYEKENGSQISSRMTEVECTYKVGNIDGIRYVAFSTYGSAERKAKGNASQSLHFDKNSAKKMIEILRKEFDL